MYQFLRHELEATVQQAATLIAENWPREGAPDGFRWQPQIHIHEEPDRRLRFELTWVAIGVLANGRS